LIVIAITRARNSGTHLAAQLAANLHVQRGAQDPYAGPAFDALAQPSPVRFTPFFLPACLQQDSAGDIGGSCHS
jgi:hypothetical protein